MRILDRLTLALSHWRERRHRRWLKKNHITMPKPDPRTVVRNTPGARR